ncbi:MAG: hypothetical protein ACP5KD_05320 [Fervidobacterium sp.]
MDRKPNVESIAFALGFLTKAYNVHREITSMLEFAVSFDTSNSTIFQVNYLYKIFVENSNGLYLLGGIDLYQKVDQRIIEGEVGLLAKIGFFNINFSLPLYSLTSFNSFRVGGGFIW